MIAYEIMSNLIYFQKPKDAYNMKKWTNTQWILCFQVNKRYGLVKEVRMKIRQRFDKIPQGIVKSQYKIKMIQIYMIKYLFVFLKADIRKGSKMFYGIYVYSTNNIPDDYVKQIPFGKSTQLTTMLGCD